MGDSYCNLSINGEEDGGRRREGTDLNIHTRCITVEINWTEKRRRGKCYGGI